MSKVKKDKKKLLLEKNGEFARNDHHRIVLRFENGKRLRNKKITYTQCSRTSRTAKNPGASWEYGKLYIFGISGK